MSVIILLIAAGGLVAGGFLAAFAWAVRTGQFDDTASPPLRILFDDTPRASIGAAVSVSESRPHEHTDC
jgi:cbb3-type cytochrome oxidase maturation protein